MSKNRSVAPLNLYCGLMDEIKIRVKSIETIIKDQMAPPFPGAIAREHCFLQLRMVCETLAIGCLVIHNQTSDVKAFEKLWNAKDIMDRLERLNPHSFPRPIQIIRHPPGSQFAMDIIPIMHPPFTKDGFLKLYGHCCDALHRGHLRKIANYIPAGPVNLQEIGSAVNELVNLLRAHQISSPDYSTHYHCVMENHPGGNAAMLTSESDPQKPPRPPAA